MIQTRRWFLTTLSGVAAGLISRPRAFAATPMQSMPYRQRCWTAMSQRGRAFLAACFC
jgi:hypothetical protein